MSNASLFEQVGPTVEYGTVAITPDDAERFRQAALQGSKINELEVNDTDTLIRTSSYATGFLTDAAADYDVYTTTFFTKTTMGAEPDFWRSVVTFARDNSKHNDTKIYNIYEVESYQGVPEFAVRRVRIVRNLARIAFDKNGEPIEDIYSRQHKTFETPMTPNDIQVVEQRSRRIMERSRLTRPR